MASSGLFKAAAVLNALSIPGHMKYGFDYIYPSVALVPGGPKHAFGKQGAVDGWDYMNGSLAIAALLNWQWSTTGGPTTKFENLMFWTLFASGGLCGIRYFKVGSYKPLLCHWVAPVLAVAALWLK
ncbi:hypothetical protein B0A52_01066 [Exophiala mesophila]|uniref:Uncharacterized protein n=1 Tax=Exophiala mesophila TaxID=212818 RepID=A0A0D2ACU9_EXOME|nr:uncharacterized protein PV10_00594 [Exophiala mesophila]KIV96773.1 hypothetical protein PV10_00594 [Exophiala mesophila]RVX74789.1 hypothetical protein B0A52_01066 [Exophiala mesophila]